ncbi:MAG: DUF3386 domain-containing protein [Cyanobacteria bacterium P01_D01_bin.73]
MTTTVQTDARALFRAAFENRYTWGANFPGYSADIELRQGDEVFKGKVAIASDFSVSVDGVDNKDVVKTLEIQLRDIVTHRRSSTFEKVHSENQFAIGDTDETGAVEIKVSGKSMGSGYKVRSGEICHVSRTVGPMRFEIDTRKTLDTGSGYVPTTTDASFYKKDSGDLIKEISYEDSYEKIGDYYLMVHQTLRVKEKGGETVTELTFSNVTVA